MICARCHRPLRVTMILIGGHSYGPKCAAAIKAVKPEPGAITILHDMPREPGPLTRALSWLRGLCR